MQYRTMPKSSDKLSVLGFGCMRLPCKGRVDVMSPVDTEPAKKLVRYAIDHGVNYLDTAYPYHRGDSERFLGEHILTDGYRDKVYIATKLPCFSINKRARMDEIFAKQLKKLRVEMIDYYMLHALDGKTWDKMKGLGVIEFMDGIKQDGKIRHIGFSFHGHHADFIRIVDDYDWDFAQVQFNIMDINFQAGLKGIEYAASKGLGIIVMEPLRGGALVGKIPKEVQEIYDNAPIDRTPVDWAFSWIYNHPAVTTVLSGMNDLDHIKQNIHIADSTLPSTMSEQELVLIDKVRDTYLSLMKVGCTGCAYCMPCPAGIDIPGAFKRLNNYHMFRKLMPQIFHMGFAGVMTEDGKPHWTSTCIDCGKCEEKCPQNIKVRTEFKSVQKSLEGRGIKFLASVARKVLGPKKAKK